MNNYTPRLPAKAHQIEALRRVKARPDGIDAFALLLEMGTGKSKIIIDEWGERVTDGDLDSLLVIAPAGSYANWFLDRSSTELSEITKHLDPTLRKRTAVYHWESGGGVNWRQGLVEFLKRRGPRVFVVNIEAISSVARAREACKTFLMSGRTMMVIDESSKARTPGAKRTRALWALGQHAVSRRIATGLVTPRSPLDLYGQFRFLDWRILGCNTFAQFRSRYAITRREWFPGARWPTEIVVGYQNLDQLQKKIGPWSYRVLKEDCLDLEPKVYETRDVTLTMEQKRAYAELKEFATTQLAEDSHVTATTVLTQLLRLHQLLCGHLMDEKGNLQKIKENRTDVLLDLLEDHSGKAIIWVNYEYSIHKIMECLKQEYGERSVAAFWGGNRATRHVDEGRFKSDPECRFMVATTGAGGLGNTWVVADLVIYYSNSYDLELRSQSEDRAHREGQTRQVTYIDLVARETIDEKILKALREKINLATKITGDNWREWVV